MSFIGKWKEGIAMITPLQQLEATQKGNWVMLIGIICGMVATAFKFKDFWWIEIILAVSIFNQVLGMVGIQQKIKALRKFEEDAEDIIETKLEKEVENV